MKKLHQLTGEYWIDLNNLSGVKKITGGYLLQFGPLGSVLGSRIYTEPELNDILKKADTTLESLVKC